MKARTLLITTFLLLMAFELINASNSIKKKETKKVKKFMQGINHELIKSNNVKKVRDLDDEEDDGPNPLYEACKEFSKPSTAFTVVIIIYMILIIVGAVLVLVLLKGELEK